MFRLVSICFLTTLILTTAAKAQSDPHALEQALQGKQFALRSFAADSTTRYTWTDGKLVTDPVRVHTLGVFVTKSLKLKKGKVVIEGERSTILEDTADNKVIAVGKVPMTLEINLGATDPALVLPHLQDGLFYLDLKSALAALPWQLQKTLPFKVPIQPASPSSTSKTQRFFDTDHWTETLTDEHKLTPPKAVNAVYPEYGDLAESEKVRGTVVLVFLVSATGKVEDVWLARPLGHGLDEKAAVAAYQYRFTPAQYEGRDVGIEIVLEINFDVT